MARRPWSRTAPRRTAAVLLPLLAGPVAAVLVAGGRLPPCAAGAPASTRPPEAGPPRTGTADACRAEPSLSSARRPSTGGRRAARHGAADTMPGSALELGGLAPGGSAAGGRLPRREEDGRAEDATGYRHLGATSDEKYAGVSGRLAVTDPGVRRGSNDFLAARFMALGDADGRARWLEAGWTEDGWRNDDTQHVYTYDTATMRWAYYDQYRLRPGQRVRVVLQSGDSTDAGTRWRAWLWWDNTWNLLAARRLPIGDHARIEQYVEVYLDPTRGGDYRLPATAVTDVTVQPRPGGAFRPWRGPAVPTTESPGYPGYCVTWRTPHDTWTAATC